MKRDSSVGLQATQLTGCVCAEGKQVQRLSHAEHACTLKMTSSLIIESVLRPPLTIVRSDKRLLTEIPHFNSNRKKETRLRCNQMLKNDNTGKTVLPWSQEPWFNKHQYNKASPTVHAASDSTAGSNNRADCGHNVVMVMFSEAVHQQMLILCQFPQFQSTCRVAFKQSPA